MTWTTTAEAGRFLAEAGPFLQSDPVANTVLLTEARFWSWLSDPAPGARFGWWSDDTGTQGAFVEIPHHTPVCSPLSAAAVVELPSVLANADRLGVQLRDADAVTEAWRARGRLVRPTRRMTVLRLDRLRAPAPPAGTARVADAGDLALLRSWFELFQEAHPDDPSQVEFVVDYPLDHGGIVLWEVRDRPVAMASRTPEASGMTRLGLAFQPGEGTTYADAAFASACEVAARTTDQVVVLSGSPGSTATFTSLGFAPVLDRVVLDVATVQEAIPGTSMEITSGGNRNRHRDGPSPGGSTPQHHFRDQERTTQPEQSMGRPRPRQNARSFVPIGGDGVCA